MAIKINKMFADTLLDLLEKKKLEKITITDLTSATDKHLNYSAYLIDYYNRILKYRKFMSQAIRLNCQNDLKSFMETYMITWEREWFKSLYMEKYAANPPENIFSFHNNLL